MAEQPTPPQSSIRDHATIALVHGPFDGVPFTPAATKMEQPSSLHLLSQAHISTVISHTR